MSKESTTPENGIQSFIDFMKEVLGELYHQPIEVHVSNMLLGDDIKFEGLSLTLFDFVNLIDRFRGKQKIFIAWCVFSKNGESVYIVNNLIAGC